MTIFKNIYIFYAAFVLSVGVEINAMQAQQALPAIMLGNWENDTPQNLVFVSGWGDSKTITLNLKSKADLDFLIPYLGGVQNTIAGTDWSGKVSIRNPNAIEDPLTRKSPELGLFFSYNSAYNTISLTLMWSSNRMGEFGQYIVRKSILYDKPGVPLIINGFLNGEKFEHSRLMVASIAQPKLLLQSAIKKIADLIKNKQISWEEAKERIPHDLHDELKGYLG